MAEKNRQPSLLRNERSLLRHTADTLAGSPERNSKAKGLFPDRHPTQKLKPHTVPLAGLITALKSSETPEKSGQGELKLCIRIGAGSDREWSRWRKGQARSRILECQIIPMISRYHSVPLIPNNYHSFWSSETQQLVIQPEDDVYNKIKVHREQL